MTSLKIILGGVISIAIQFGLAIWGWSGWVAFWSHPAFKGLAWACAVMMTIAAFSGVSMNTGEKEDRGNRWVLGAFGLIAMLGTYFAAYTDRIGFWTFGGDTMRWVGVAVCFAGGILRLIPVYVLRNRFSGLVAIQEGHKLETPGMYGLIRNPSYLGMIITSLGWVLAFRSVVGLILMCTMMVPLVARIHAEERLLHEHFGAEYDAYVARTWRLLPGIY